MHEWRKQKSWGLLGQQRDGWHYFLVISSHDSNSISQKMTVCFCVFRIYGRQPASRRRVGEFQRTWIIHCSHLLLACKHKLRGIETRNVTDSVVSWGLRRFYNGNINTWQNACWATCWLDRWDFQHFEFSIWIRLSNRTLLTCLSARNTFVQIKKKLWLPFVITRYEPKSVQFRLICLVRV